LAKVVFKTFLRERDMLKTNSKARMLDELKDKLHHFVVPELLYFTAQSWAADNKEILTRITSTFAEGSLIIRSSACDEDGSQASRAGEYETVLNVPANDPAQIRTAVEKVIASYQRNGLRANDDEVIVQEMLQNTIMSGVVFTHDLNTGAPYYVVNYDDVTGMTNTVTAGDGEYSNRTLYIHRDTVKALRSERFQRLIVAIQELEQVTQSQFLDVEFAMDGDKTPYLLQVRTITTQPNWNRAIAKRIDSTLSGIQSFVRERFKTIPGVYGHTSVLGQMPDWNPAEMIGRAPRALAFSLYKKLITDHAWRIARQRMGYAVPMGHPLMVSLAGQPFIDTRMSFHSFLPTQLSPSLSHKLVDIWLKRLREHPELHDKIEFEVAITTYSFDIDEKIKTMTDGALNADERIEFITARKHQTLEHLKGVTSGSINAALAYIDTLAKKQKANCDDLRTYGIGTLFGMLDDCIYLGTIPFSILARHAFIARTLLLSLQRLGVLTREEIHHLQAGIRTVASELVDDINRFREGEISRDTFMANYGHLRPGTYDILSCRYDQMDNFSLGDTPRRGGKKVEPFILGAGQEKAINNLLQSEGFDGVDAKRLLAYVREATVGREFAKFVFTRTISDMLELIAAYGEERGLSRDEMSHIPVGSLLDISTTSEENTVEDRLRAISGKNAEQHALASAIRLPQILFDEAGIHVIPFQVTHPNFITTKKVSAECVHLSSGQSSTPLTGKIVLIENADPGFDWIFAHQITGLITQYGGANSHMAIRCAEFGIPAAIGCGEQRFNAITKATQVMLDCSSSVIQTIH